MNSPYFSIVVPVYNVAPYLKQCLDSILSQTFTDWEAICIDDGSSDGSGVLLDQYAAKDSRFRVFHQANQGLCAVRQRAISLCRGVWMSAVDSDDWVSSRFLEHFFAAVDRQKPDMAWTGYLLEDGCKTKYYSNQCSNSIAAYAEALIDGTIMGSIWCRVYSVDFIRHHNISFPTEILKTYEDISFNSAFLAFHPRISYFPAADYHYVYRKGSIAHRTRQDDIESFVLQTQIPLEQYLEKVLHEFQLMRPLRRRKECIKLSHYLDVRIGQGCFNQLFPEIRFIKEARCSLLFRTLFWLTTHGMRPFVLCFVNAARCAKQKWRQWHNSHING